MSNGSSWRAWVPRVAIMVMFAAVVLGYFNSRAEGTDFTDNLLEWMRRAIPVGYALLTTILPCSLVACLLFYQRRFQGLAWSAVAACAVYFLVELANHFLVGPLAGRNTSPLSLLLDDTRVIALRMGLIMLVLFPRLSRRGRQMQILAIVLIVLVTGVELSWGLVWPAGSLVVRVVQFVLLWSTVIVLGVAGYLGLFGRVPAADEPPVDAAGTVSLTCPRCGAAQVVATGGGECANCRLKIFIGLEEGRCPKCGYLLRGLTSGRCPECGTAISMPGADPQASPAAATEPAAPAAVKDEAQGIRSQGAS